MAFAKGSTVIWKPIKARAKCYGHPIATDPIPVTILSGPDRCGRYRVRIECKKSKAWLNKDEYGVYQAALRSIQNEGK